MDRTTEPNEATAVDHGAHANTLDVDDDPSMQPSWNFKALKLMTKPAHFGSGDSQSSSTLSVKTIDDRLPPEPVLSTKQNESEVEAENQANSGLFLPGYDSYLNFVGHGDGQPSGQTSSAMEDNDGPVLTEHLLMHPLGSGASGSGEERDDRGVASSLGFSPPNSIALRELDRSQSDPMVSPFALAPPLSIKSYSDNNVIADNVDEMLYPFRNSQLELDDQFGAAPEKTSESSSLDPSHNLGKIIPVSEKKRAVVLPPPTINSTFTGDSSVAAFSVNEDSLDIKSADTTAVSTTVLDASKKSWHVQPRTCRWVAVAICGMILVIIIISVVLSLELRKMHKGSGGTPLIASPSVSPTPASPRPTQVSEKGGSAQSPVAPFAHAKPHPKGPSRPTVSSPIAPTNVRPYRPPAYRPYPEHGTVTTHHPVLPPNLIPPSLK